MAATPTRTIAPAGAGGGVTGTWAVIGGAGLFAVASLALWAGGGVQEAWWSHTHDHGFSWKPGPFSLYLSLTMVRGGKTLISTQWPHTDPAHLFITAAVLMALLLVPIVLVVLSFVRGARRPHDPARLMAGPADVKHLTRAKLVRDIPRLRPSLAGMKPKDISSSQVGWTLGRTAPERPLLRGSYEDVALAFMAPRSGKTTAFAVPQILEAQGAVVATGNKPDIVTATAALRASDTGERVWVFDPQQIARAEQTWWWNPLRAVTNIEEAERLATHFVVTVEDKGKGDIWGPAAAELLSGLFLAAACSGGTMRDVYEWITDANSPLAAQLLRQAGHRAIAGSLDETRTMAEETRASVFFTARTAVRCLRNEQILTWVNPPQTDRTSPELEEFLPAGLPCSRQTLYLLSKEGGGSAGPLVAALTDQVLREAVKAAEGSPGQRLDAPLTVLLDEAANICRISDLPTLYSHFGSRGIVCMTILQSYPQGVGVWGESGMKALFGAATVKIIGSGSDDPNFAEDISRLIGDSDVVMVSVSSAEGKTTRSRSMQQRRILSAADIRALPKGRVIVLTTGARPAMLYSAPWYAGPRAPEISAADKQAQSEQREATVAGRNAVIPLPVLADSDASSADSNARRSA